MLLRRLGIHSLGKSLDLKGFKNMENIHKPQYLSGKTQRCEVYMRIITRVPQGSTLSLEYFVMVINAMISTYIIIT